MARQIISNAHAGGREPCLGVLCCRWPGLLEARDLFEALVKLAPTWPCIELQQSVLSPLGKMDPRMREGTQDRG